MNKYSQNTKELPIDPAITESIEQDIAQQPEVQAADTIMTVTDLKMHFPVTRGLFKRQVGAVKAVDGVSFSIKRGKTLGIVGESGSGKSTVGNCVMRNYDITSGQIIFNGKDITHTPHRELRKLRNTLQMITQDPFASLDPRMTIRQSILEGVRIQRAYPRDEQDDLVTRMLELVGLNPRFADRYPHEFSGGLRHFVDDRNTVAFGRIAKEVVAFLRIKVILCIFSAAEVAQNLAFFSGKKEASDVIMIVRFAVVSALGSKRKDGSAL